MPINSVGIISYSHVVQTGVVVGCGGLAYAIVRMRRDAILQNGLDIGTGIHTIPLKHGTHDGRMGTPLRMKLLLALSSSEGSGGTRVCRRCRCGGRRKGWIRWSNWNGVHFLNIVTEELMMIEP